MALTPEEKAEKEAAKADRHSVTVVFPGGSREYTREIHGDHFEDLAAEFAGKKGGDIV